MNRCSSIIIALSAGLLANLAALSVAHAQASEPLAAAPIGTRAFPANAIRGKLRVGQAPEISIDGKLDRLSPGSRIRDPLNRVLMPALLVGQEFTVNFVRNPMGDVQEIWILTDEEIKIKPKSPNFGSNSNAGARDDGKTPFNQLPTFDELNRQQR